MAAELSQVIERNMVLARKIVALSALLLNLAVLAVAEIKSKTTVSDKDCAGILLVMPAVQLTFC